MAGTAAASAQACMSAAAQALDSAHKKAAGEAG
jgi:hypothetical protein